MGLDDAVWSQGLALRILVGPFQLLHDFVKGKLNKNGKDCFGADLPKLPSEGNDCKQDPESVVASSKTS